MTPQPLKRRFERLLDGPFDLLVIGGGVYGAWIAYDAALRGLRVALVEQDDWAAATSSSSSKLIHGGLRYLEQRDFGLVRKSLDERRRLVQLAPHQIRPLRFALPVYAGARPGRLKLKAGLWLYDRLAGRRQPVGPHEGFSSAAFGTKYPFVRTDGLRGGFTYGDCGTDDARLVLEVVAAASQHGAVVVNHTRAERLVVEDGRVVGAMLQDRESGTTTTVRAGLTFNCAGPWLDKLGDASDVVAPQIRMSKGAHLVLPALPTEDAFLLPTSDGRIVFLIPWYGRTLLGTTDTDYRAKPGAVRTESDDVAYLLNEANRYLDTQLLPADIIATFAGLRVFPSSPDARTYTISREWQCVETTPGLLSSIGGKYTSARADSALGVDRVLAALGREPVACRTGDQPLPWTPTEAFDTFRTAAVSRGVAAGLDEQTAWFAVGRHGRRFDDLIELCQARPELAARIVSDAPFCLGDLLLAVRDEMARSLVDALRRRMPLLLLARPDRQALERCAALAREVLHWSDDRCRQERQEVAAIVDSQRPPT